MSSTLKLSGFTLPFGEKLGDQLDDFDDGATDHSGIRWGRVAAVVAYFLLTFYYLDHDAAAFAGRQVADTPEDDIADQYVDEIEIGSGFRKLVLITYGACGIACLMHCRRRQWNVQRFAALAMSALVAWMVLSVLWSLDPGLTVRRLVAAGMVLIGSVGYARLLRPDELLAVALATFGCFVSYSLLLDISGGGKPWNPNYRFGGTLHPNQQATYCGMLCLAAYCLPARYGSQWVTRALFVFGLVLLYQTQSRTSMFAVIVGLVIASLVKLSSALRWQAAWLLLALVSVASIAVASFSEGQRAGLAESALMGRTEQAGTLSGRAPLWRELSRFAAQRPLTGYGFESFWTPDNIDAVMKSQKWALQSAHNAYFETVLQLGLPGLAFACATVFASFNLAQSAYQRSRFAGYAFIYGVLGFAMTNGLLESNFAKLKYPTVIALIGVCSVIAFYPVDPSGEGDSRPLLRKRAAAPDRRTGRLSEAIGERQIA